MFVLYTLNNGALAIIFLALPFRAPALFLSKDGKATWKLQMLNFMATRMKLELWTRPNEILKFEIRLGNISSQAFHGFVP